MQWVEVYLGGQYDLDHVKTYHYFADQRIYNKTKTEISLGNGDNRYFTIFDSDREGKYPEPKELGKVHETSRAYIKGKIEVKNCKADVYISDYLY